MAAGTPTSALLRRLLAGDGTLLDIGAGRGRASLPLASEGHRLTAIEKDPGMIAGLREDSDALDLAVTTVEGSWPDVAPQEAVYDVVMAAHVVYDVPDLGPFLSAMDTAARRAVVLELTETHPWSELGSYYRVLHGLDRPAGPGVDDLVAVVTEVIGVAPQVERWGRESGLWFESWDEIIALYRRRLVLPPDRDDELVSLLEPEVVEASGRFHVGAGPRMMATVWWEKGG